MRVAAPIAIFAAGVALAAPAAAGVQSRPDQTATRDYTGAGVDGVAGVTPSLYGDDRAQGGELQAVTITPPSGDRTVSVRIADRTGQRVLAAVVEHMDGNDADNIELGRVCGAPATFHLVRPDRLVTVYLLVGSCGSALSVPTTGTVTFTFRKR